MAETRETTFQDFLTVVFHRKWIVIPVVVFASLFVIYLNTRQPTVYESQSRVLVRRGEQSSIFNLNPKILPWEEEISSQIEVIRSQPVMKEARAILNENGGGSGDEGAVPFRAGKVRTGVVGESNVLWIAYTDFNPEFARKAVDAVTRAYMAYYSVRAAPPQVEEFFDKEIDSLEADLAIWRKRKSTFIEDNQILEIDGQRRALFDQARDVQRKLDKIEEEISERETNIARIDEFAANSEAPSMPSVVGGAGQLDVFTRLLNELSRLYVEREELLSVFTPSHHEVEGIQNQIDALEDRFRAELESFRAMEVTELEVLIARREKLDAILQGAETELATLPIKELELKQIDQKLEILSYDYRELQKKRTQARISVASTPEWTVTLISPASAPFPKNTKDYVRMALGPFLSLIVGLGFAFFWDSLDRSLKSVREAEDYLSIPVVAVVGEKEKLGVPSPGYFRLFRKPKHQPGQGLSG